MKKLISIFVLAFICLFGLVACGKEPEKDPNQGEPGEKLSETLSNAKAYLKQMYEKAATTTSADYTRPAKGEGYTVTWTVDTDKVKVILSEDGNSVTIDVDEESEEEVSYKLTATIATPDGEKTELSWNHVVPKFQVATWETYVAAKAGDPIVVEGVVTAIIGKANGNSYNCLYLQDKDNKGAYYVYGAAADPSAADSGIKVGMTVRVSGEKDIYSGTHEIKNGVFKVVDETIKTIEPVDYTELFTNAKDLKDESIVAAQGLLVTIKGVTIDSVTEANGYYNFKLAGKTSYVRISSSVCPLTKDEQKTFKADFSEHIGWTADATGVICVYDGNFYLTPVAANSYEYKSLPELDDAGMVAFVKEHLTLVAEITEPQALTLPAKGTGYEAVAITWATSDETLAPIAEGKVTFGEPDEDTEVTLTATLTSGEVSETKEFKVKVLAPVSDLIEAEVLAKLFALEEGKALNGKQVLAGTIVKIDTAYSTEYKNITVTIKPDVATDDEHNVQCFRMVGGEDLAEGDHIVVTGILKNYKGTKEFDAKCTYSKTLSVEEAKQLVVLEKVFALEEGKALNGKQVLAGTIVKIDTAYSTEYKNITVTIKPDVATDDEHNVQCFRMVGGEDLAEGDHIVVTGILKNYKGTKEFDAKCTYSKTLSLEEAKGLVIVEQAFALAAGKAMNAKVTLTGEIVKIDTAYSTEYKNISVTIKVNGVADDEHNILCFRMVGGEDLAVGDVISVTGLIKNYNSTVEFDAKCTYVKLAAEAE